MKLVGTTRYLGFNIEFFEVESKPYIIVKYTKGDFVIEKAFAVGFKTEAVLRHADSLERVLRDERFAKRKA